MYRENLLPTPKTQEIVRCVMHGVRAIARILATKSLSQLIPPWPRANTFHGPAAQSQRCRSRFSALPQFDSVCATTAAVFLHTKSRGHCAPTDKVTTMYARIQVKALSTHCSSVPQTDKRKHFRFAARRRLAATACGRCAQAVGDLKWKAGVATTNQVCGRAQGRCNSFACNKVFFGINLKN